MSFSDDGINDSLRVIRLSKKVLSLQKRIKKMKEALKYCADHAHPSIVQEVAKKALTNKERLV